MASLRFPFLRSRSRLAGVVRADAKGRRGLEIGGPSRIFSAKGRLPLYDALGSLDGCDFRVSTTWSGERGAEPGYAYPAPSSPGRLHVEEAGVLAGLPDASYDVLLASHVLEHLANPLRALAAWARVIRSGGHLVLVVPHREGTFDHRRPVTTLAHLREDLALGVGEDDLTHLPEILRLHDLGQDPAAGSAETFEARARDNPSLRCLHHHVFDTELVIRVLDETAFSVVGVDVMRPYHVAVLARARARAPESNDAWLAPSAAWRRRSPFAGDRGL